MIAQNFALPRVLATPARRGARRAGAIWHCCCLTVAVSTAAYAGPPPVQFHTSDEYPERLSAWGVIQKHGNRLVLGEKVTAYDINTPLFSDYALKLRTLWMPAGTSAEYAPRDSFAMPAGTIISKTFFYPSNNWDGPGPARLGRRHRRSGPGAYPLDRDTAARQAGVRLGSVALCLARRRCLAQADRRTAELRSPTRHPDGIARLHRTHQKRLRLLPCNRPYR